MLFSGMFIDGFNYANKKAHPSMGFSDLVEAAGIEPASANPLLSGLHAYPIFKFNCFTTDWQVVKTAIPLFFSSLI